jgi:hypothetical protein
MYRVWYAQRRPLELDAEASRAFLDDSVDVYKQVRVEKKHGIARVVSSALGSMPRIAFMRLWVVWFAMAISAGAVAMYAPNTMNPSDMAVQQAVTYLRDTFGGSGIDMFNNAYFDHVFSTTAHPTASSIPASQDLGYYARSTSMSGGFMVGEPRVATLRVSKAPRQAKPCLHPPQPLLFISGSQDQTDNTLTCCFAS